MERLYSVDHSTVWNEYIYLKILKESDIISFDDTKYFVHF